MNNKLVNFFKTLWPKKDQTQLSSRETEFLPAVLEVTETPPSPVGRLVLWTIVALLVCGVAWMFFGYVDEVAVANGKIIPTGQVKMIQAEDKGVVKAINVREGDIVKVGQLLVELDQTFSAADLNRNKKQVAYYNLEIERLLAEMEGGTFSPSISPDLDPKDLEFQQKLFLTRTFEVKTKIAAAEAQIRQSQASIRSAQAARSNYAQQLEIAKDKENRISQLLADNAVSLFQVLDQRTRRIDLEQQIAIQEAEIAKNESVLAQSLQSLAGVTAEREQDISSKLVEDRKQLNTYIEELKKVQEKDRLAKILSPVDGRVDQLSIHTVGGVVTAAQVLMSVVPEGTTMDIEAWVDNKDIGFIHVGQAAEVKVNTFNFQKYGIIDAVVMDISADARDENTEKDKEKAAKYRVILKPSRDFVVVGDRKVPLGPGMLVSAEIKIKQKRIMEYFLDPFRKYQNESLRER